MGKTFAGTIEVESVKRQGRAMVIDQEAIGQFSAGSFQQAVRGRPFEVGSGWWAVVGGWCTVVGGPGWVCGG